MSFEKICSCGKCLSIGGTGVPACGSLSLCREFSTTLVAAMPRCAFTMWDKDSSLCSE
jgi:hypothetical protein